MVKGPYSDLFIPYHITDMSIVRRRDINEAPVHLDSYEVSSFNSDTEVISTKTHSTRAFGLVDKLRGGDSKRTKKLMDDLIEENKKKDDKISKLTEELKKASLDEEE